MANFRLSKTEEIREQITQEQQRQILAYYRELYEEARSQLKSNRGLSEERLVLLMRRIENRMQEINNDIENDVVYSMETVCQSAVEEQREMLSAMGFASDTVAIAFQNVPLRVVESIQQGTVYQKGWTLSNAIWKNTREEQQKLQNIIATGTAQGKSAYEIAKDLEKYVKPGAAKQARTIYGWKYRKDSHGNWIYMRDSKGNILYDENGNPIRKRYRDSYYPGRVDYNALRLSRTMTSHAYQQSFERVNRNDPFVIGYKWLTSNFHSRICPLCLERAETDQYGLGVGVFPKDELPLDHPNGMCTFEAVMPDSMEEIAERIARWYESPVGTYPEIDNYAMDFLR